MKKCMHDCMKLHESLMLVWHIVCFSVEVSSVGFMSVPKARNPVETQRGFIFSLLFLFILKHFI